MELFESIVVSEMDFPMNEGGMPGMVLPAYGDRGGMVPEDYCERAEKRLKYAISGGLMSSAMYRLLRDDYISAVGFMYLPLYRLRDAYINHWIDLYDTSIWTYREFCFFLDYYTASGGNTNGGKRDAWNILLRNGYSPDKCLKEWLASRRRKVEHDIANFIRSGNNDYSDLQFVEDYVALIIKDYINNRYVDEDTLCSYIVSYNSY
jgi:hypothetical protein